MPHRYCEQNLCNIFFFFFKCKNVSFLEEENKEETKAHGFWKIWFLLLFHGNLVRSCLSVVYEFEELSVWNGLC